MRSRVGYLTQSPSVYADLTVRENLAYFARVLSAPAARIDSVLDTVDMGGFPAELSVHYKRGV